MGLFILEVYEPYSITRHIRRRHRAPDPQDGQAEEFAGAAEQHADEVRTLKRVIQNDRTLLPPAGGLGLKAPNRPVAGPTP